MMQILQEMLQRTTALAERDSMMRSVAPFFDSFNISHFYYTKVFFSGYFSTIGTNIDLYEYYFNQTEMLKSSPILCKPDTLKSGVSLLKNNPDPTYKKFLGVAWNKFNVNYTINIQRKTSNGIEACGFGVKHNHPKTDEYLINELPIICKFIDFFRKENDRLIQISEDNQISLTSLFGCRLNEANDICPSFEKKNQLLKQLGLVAFLSLTTSEINILKFMANGFPASYIAQQLFLSCRTVEHHLDSIKLKLECSSKVELIKKAQEMVSIIHPASIFSPL